MCVCVGVGVRGRACALQTGASREVRPKGLPPPRPLGHGKWRALRLEGLEVTQHASAVFPHLLVELAATGRVLARVRVFSPQ